MPVRNANNTAQASPTNLDGPQLVLRSGVIYLVDARSQLFAYNPATRDLSYIGLMSEELYDIAISPTGGFYGVTASALYNLNEDTAALTRVASLQRSTNSFVIDISGRALTHGSTGSSLVELNLTTGNGAILGNAGHSRGAEGDLAFYGSRLFISTGDRRIDEINPTNGALIRSTQTTVDGIYGLVSFEGRILAFAGQNVYEFSPASLTLTLLHTLPTTISGRTVGAMNGAAAFDFGQTGRALLGSAGNDTLSGTALDDFLQGGTGADILIGMVGSDRLLGGEGNDQIRGGAGNDFIDGGVGMDLAFYAGGRRQYVASSAGVSGNGEGADTLINIEGLVFADGVLSFDVDGRAAQVMRLYDAALDRLPDANGFEAVLDLLEAGQTIQQVAAVFLNSAEFQSRYGALTNQRFIEQLYLFCLNRPGDAAGIQNWVNALNSGTTRTEMLVIFSESQEHRNLTQGALSQGLWVADDDALKIARMYDATFDRLPDSGGLATWTANLKGGMSMLDIATAFAGSGEFQQRYGAVSNEQFIRQMYQFCLNREPDTAGMQTWVNALNSGTSRAQMLLNFSESAEHVALTRPLWIGGVSVSNPAGAATIETTKTPSDERLVLPGLHDGDLYASADLRMTAEPADDFFAPSFRDEAGWLADETPTPGSVAGAAWSERMMVAIDAAPFDPACGADGQGLQPHDWLA